MDFKEIKNNVYVMVMDIEVRSEQKLKYVQIRRETIQTWFKKHEIVQLIDVS